jgi:hypothetical protein
MPISCPHCDHPNADALGPTICEHCHLPFEATPDAAPAVLSYASEPRPPGRTRGKLGLIFALAGCGIGIVGGVTDPHHVTLFWVVMMSLCGLLAMGLGLHVAYRSREPLEDVMGIFALVLGFVLLAATLILV